MPAPENRDPDETPPDEGAAALQAYADAVEEGRDEDADEAMLEFLAELAKFAEENEDDPRMRLLGEADNLAEAGDWDGAEAAWRKAVDTSESADHSLLPHQRLVDLYTWLGRHDDALAQARRATEASRLTDTGVLRSVALEQEAHCLFAVGDAAAAMARAEESLTFLGPRRMADPIRARLHVAIARYRLAMDDAEGTQRELEAAKRLLDSGKAPDFGGPDFTSGSWWAVTARLRRLRGDVNGAVEAWEAAAESRRGVSPMDPGIILTRLRVKVLADILRELGRDRQSIGDLAGAEEALAEARSLYREIGLPEPAT